MARPFRTLCLALFGVAAGLLPGLGHGQELTPNFALNRPAWVQFDPELSPRAALFALGPVRLSTAGSTTGTGLSLQAGQQWFARVGVGRSLDADVMSVGGGYRFADGQALSMHVTRQLGQDRLGLAVRYDWDRSYLRLSYDTALRPAGGAMLRPGGADTLRFSAGLRF